MKKIYFAMRLLLVICAHDLNACEPLLATVARPRVDNRVLSPGRVVPDTWYQSVRQYSESQGQAVLAREEQSAPFREFVRIIESSHAAVSQQHSWRNVIRQIDISDRVQFTSSGDHYNTYADVQLCVEDFIRVDSPYVWGFDPVGRPFIGVLLRTVTMPNGQTNIIMRPLDRIQASNDNQDQIHVQVLFLQDPAIPGLWVCWNNVRRDVGKVIASTFVTLADMIAADRKESHTDSGSKVP